MLSDPAANIVGTETVRERERERMRKLYSIYKFCNAMVTKTITLGP